MFFDESGLLAPFVGDAPLSLWLFSCSPIADLFAEPRLDFRSDNRQFEDYVGPGPHGGEMQIEPNLTPAPPKGNRRSLPAVGMTAAFAAVGGQRQLQLRGDSRFCGCGRTTALAVDGVACAVVCALLAARQPSRVH
jgi:hypothetical protein